MGRAFWSVTKPRTIYSESVATAIELHRAVHGAMPAGLVVHPSNAERAAGALASLGLALPVTTARGCSSEEIWLEVAREQ